MRVSGNGCILSKHSSDCKVKVRNSSRKSGKNAKIQAWNVSNTAQSQEPCSISIPPEAGDCSMRDVMDENELLAAKRPRDTEVTLGPMTVASLFFGLLLICGLCFGLGYTMG